MYAPKNNAQCPQSVIPGQDQGSYLNDCTMTAKHSEDPLTRFLVLARNDSVVTYVITIT